MPSGVSMPVAIGSSRTGRPSGFELSVVVRGFVPESGSLGEAEALVGEDPEHRVQPVLLGETVRLRQHRHQHRRQFRR